MSEKIKVTIWNENLHEHHAEGGLPFYPDGIHNYIKGFLSKDAGLEIRTATIQEPEHGLTDEVLNDTDVLVWWGHMGHDQVSDAVVAKVQARVYAGMGFVALHSAHHSKPFKAILGATGNLSWGRDQKEVIWNLMPAHPIAEGIPEHFTLPLEELYSEPFYIPNPDAVVFGGWYEDGNIFRSGVCFLRGMGKIFYFQPGHEWCKSFHNEYVQRIIDNAIHWAKPAKIGFTVPDGAPKVEGKVIDEFDN